MNFIKDITTQTISSKVKGTIDSHLIDGLIYGAVKSKKQMYFYYYLYIY